MLSEQIQKRERKKLERTKEQKTYLEMILFPLEYVIRPILNQFMEIDRNKFFLNHVTADEAPDYNIVIAKSMCFSEIYQKMASHQYTTLDQFKQDVSLIWQNSMDYNANDTRYYKIATRLKLASKKLFASAEYKMSRFHLQDGVWAEPIDPTIFDYERESDEEIVIVNDEPVPSPRQEDKEQRDGTTVEYPTITITSEIEPPRKLRSTAVDEELPKDIDVIKKVQENSIQALNVLDDKKIITQTIITNYFAEQRMREQQRIQKREEKRLQELQAAKEKVDQAENTPTLQEKEKTLEKRTVTDTAAQGEKRKAPSRLTRSAGLQASIEELTKRPKISHEARTLFASYNGVSHLDKPVEVFKENRKKFAPIGWVYVDEDEEEEEEQEQGKYSSDEEPKHATKQVRKKRNDIPVPNFKRGEIVWARVTGYPSHPAKFLNLSDEETQPKILASRRYTGDILVEFLQVAENHKW